MAVFTDTHCHIYLPEFDADRKTVMQRALDAGIKHMILPCVDISSLAPMKELALQYPDNIRLALGLHPSEINNEYATIIAEMQREYADSTHNYIAIGEIGIDLYWDSTFRNMQMEAFDKQLSFAQKQNLPVIIHSRNALPETLEVLQSHKGINAVFHCFGGGPEDVEQICLAGDFYFGIGGVLTFKNSRLSESVKIIPRNRIVLETDAPYLAPVPFRGKRNESSYIPAIAARLAQILETDIDDVAESTTANSLQLFGF